MGGIVCNVRRNAILQFQTIPTNPAEIMKFDSQMRSLYAAPDIAETIADETTKGMQVCAILAKSTWTEADRDFLLDTIESLYQGYS